MTGRPERSRIGSVSRWSPCAVTFPRWWASWASPTVWRRSSSCGRVQATARNPTRWPVLLTPQSWNVQGGMHDFESINKRIELGGSLASCQHDDARVLAEIGDVLATGYAVALQAEARGLGLTGEARAAAGGRSLREEFARLLLDGDHLEGAGELAQERSTLANATRGLRDR